VLEVLAPGLIERVPGGAGYIVTLGDRRRLIVPRKAVEDGSWRDLLDVVERLPERGSLEIQVAGPYLLRIHDNLHDALEDLRAQLNDRQLYEWLDGPPGDRPRIDVPAPDGNPDTVAAIVTAPYGHDALYGYELVAYGGPQWAPHDDAPSESWVQQRRHAEGRRNELIARLSTNKIERR
jgi:hypothetical protein